MRINKPTKFCKLYGVELEYEKELSDAELRLFFVYRRIVDWDNKHTDTFGSTAITIRQLQTAYLPDWSVGKISNIRRSLIGKRWLEKRPEHRIGIREFRIFRSNGFKIAEKYIPWIRQGVPLPELPVRTVEKPVTNNDDLWIKKKEELKGKMGW